MAKKRLSDTGALTGQGYEGNVEHSIRSRKISNGYVISETTCNPSTGEYRSSERFSESVPTLVPGRVKGGRGESGARDAAGYTGLGDTMRALEDGE